MLRSAVAFSGTLSLTSAILSAYSAYLHVVTFFGKSTSLMGTLAELKSFVVGNVERAYMLPGWPLQFPGGLRIHIGFCRVQGLYVRAKLLLTRNRALKPS